MSRHTLLLILLAQIAVAAFAANLYFGSVAIAPHSVTAALTGNDGEDVARFIVMQSRLPMAIAAALGGASLAVAGLLLQTSFRNPLAGPSILGINSGASLGVALVVLAAGSVPTTAIGGNVMLIGGALAGSGAVMALLLFFSAVLRSGLMVLIAGIMTGYLASSVIALLNAAASAENIQAYVMWGMGSFGTVTQGQLPVFAVLTLIGLVLALSLVKPLNLLMLGDLYARNLGVNLQRVRNSLLLASCLLAGVTTAYCGPVSFIGLAVPHICRLVIRTDDHRILLPACIAVGALTALGCNLISVIPTPSLPLNAVTPLVGVPVILYVILRKR